MYFRINMLTFYFKYDNFILYIFKESYMKYKYFLVIIALMVLFTSCSRNINKSYGEYYYEEDPYMNTVMIIDGKGRCFASVMGNVIELKVSKNLLGYKLTDYTGSSSYALFKKNKIILLESGTKMVLRKKSKGDHQFLE